MEGASSSCSCGNCASKYPLQNLDAFIRTALLRSAGVWFSTLELSGIARSHKATFQLLHIVLNVCALTVTDVNCGRSQDSQAMADRITDEVNSILRQEDGAPQLSKQAVLDLIDQGASQGGPQAACNKSLHLNCCSSPLVVFL